MKTRKWLIPLLVAGALTAMGLLIFKSRQLPASPPLPAPNGYDDFVKAGQMLVGNPSSSPEMSLEKLRALVTQNAESLRLVRTGLSRECRVPIVYSQAYMGSHMSELASVKQLAHALNAEGKLAELEHRNHDAARAYLDGMRFSHEATRGGPLIDGLVRIACEQYGLARLQSCTTNLDAGECREVIVALEIIEKKQESFEEVLQHEREWSRRSFPFYQRIVGSFMRLFNIGSLKQNEQNVAQKFQAQDQRRRALLIRVAARACELEKGQRPKSISDLVPDYLKAIPQDPLTGTNTIFKSLEVK